MKFLTLQAITFFSTLTAAFPLTLLSRDFSSTTQNDLSNGSPCKKVSLIFARGTTESATELGKAIGGAANLAVQGVDYAANWAGALQGGDAAGSQKMAQLTRDAVARCPQTQVVLAGYSQGAQLVHNAAKMLDTAAASKIKAVTVFGDPKQKEPVANVNQANVKKYCHQGDQVCEAGTAVITPAHQNYNIDAPDAAAFINARVVV
ncbi:hypothetical protein H2199_008972 [Coniosporium tulheliwenetii]|uniref:Uncharacterized protein n=1 Tax=Coniosporium tulheliwenetii TaxID=3383036 RepID=A0ACC2YGT1_9PEZI|nr:hypothetical protein H2199_008972 [Cladosporium sp. JES 115]